MVSELSGSENWGPYVNGSYGSSELSRRLSIMVAQLYVDTVGSVEQFLHQSRIDCSEVALLSGNAGQVTTESLRNFAVPLTGRIAADLSLADGREPLRANDWRVVLYCLGSARTLREAITRCIECFEAIDLRMGRMSLRTKFESAELTLDSRRADRTIAGCVIDLQGLANFHGMLGWLIAHRLPIDSIALDYDRPLFDKIALPQLPIPVLLDAGWTGFTFPAAYLDYPIVRANDEVIDWPQHSFLFTEARKGSSLEPADEVRRFVLHALRQDHVLPSFEQLVRHLQTSTATLRRRLVDAGTSYRAIKNSCRREVALELLRGSTLTVEQISGRLAFCDSDAFRNAFRGWLGISPSRYRRDAQS